MCLLQSPPPPFHHPIKFRDLGFGPVPYQTFCICPGLLKCLATCSQQVQYLVQWLRVLARQLELRPMISVPGVKLYPQLPTLFQKCIAGYAHGAGVQSNMPLSHDWWLYHHSYLRERNDFSHATQPYDSVHRPLTKELLNAAKEVKTAKCGQHMASLSWVNNTRCWFSRERYIII